MTVEHQRWTFSLSYLVKSKMGPQPVIQCEVVHVCNMVCEACCLAF